MGEDSGGEGKVGTSHKFLVWLWLRGAVVDMVVTWWLHRFPMYRVLLATSDTRLEHRLLQVSLAVCCRVKDDCGCFQEAEWSESNV